ncbi:hypothetical protein EJ08DRAFT_677430 [Tothia fuscella]|uniref:Uncharacterized protein n=1 Tax=Tothia fuscella TaxID=1048955 RepID=A0A9P4U121_9PEZI|nr:hypothetical protein EJ08DRAFT_677430 [Tothia fuscella]
MKRSGGNVACSVMLWRMVFCFSPRLKLQLPTNNLNNLANLPKLPITTSHIMFSQALIDLPPRNNFEKLTFDVRLNIYDCILDFYREEAAELDLVSATGRVLAPLRRVYSTHLANEAREHHIKARKLHRSMLASAFAFTTLYDELLPRYFKALTFVISDRNFQFGTALVEFLRSIGKEKCGLISVIIYQDVHSRVPDDPRKLFHTVLKPEDHVFHRSYDATWWNMRRDEHGIRDDLEHAFAGNMVKIPESNVTKHLPKGCCILLRAATAATDTTTTALSTKLAYFEYTHLGGSFRNASFVGTNFSAQQIIKAFMGQDGCVVSQKAINGQRGTTWKRLMLLDPVYHSRSSGFE